MGSQDLTVESSDGITLQLERRMQSTELHHHLTHGTDSFAESLTYFPEPNDLTIGPERYLNEIAVAKEAVAIPVIASLNGSTLGGWIDYAKQIEQAVPTPSS